MFRCHKTSFKGGHQNESIFKSLHFDNVHFMAYLQGLVQKSTISLSHYAVAIKYFSDMLAPIGKRKASVY